MGGQILTPRDEYTFALSSRFNRDYPLRRLWRKNIPKYFSDPKGTKKYAKIIGACQAQTHGCKIYIKGNGMKDKKFFALTSLFFLLFLAAMGIATLNQPIGRLLRARNITPSSNKSFVMVFPQTTRVQDGKIKVSVYIRDVNGASLPNRKVKVSSGTSTISFTPSDIQTTNEIGMAQFFMTSASIGRVEIAAVDIESNTSIINIPSVEFVK